MKQSSLNVLIVDDSPLIVRRLTELLKDTPEVKNVFVAGDYKVAFNVIDSEKIDLVILDLGLPGMNGISILQEIRRKDGDQSIIILTNQGNDYYEKLCLRLGADYFLDKTIDFEKLPALIKQISQERE